MTRDRQIERETERKIVKGSKRIKKKEERTRELLVKTALMITSSKIETRRNKRDAYVFQCVFVVLFVVVVVVVFGDAGRIDSILFHPPLRISSDT